MTSEREGRKVTGLTRDQIIDRAAQAIVACGFDRSVLPIENTDKWAAAAADAVLRLLADDLDAEARRNQEIQRRSLRVPPEVVTLKGAGWPLAAHYLRSLLPKDDQ